MKVEKLSKNAIKTKICNLFIHLTLYLTEEMPPKKTDELNSILISWKRGMFTIYRFS